MAAPIRLPAPLPVRHPPMLSMLRVAALACRAEARLDLAGACAALDPEADPAVLAALLARALPQALRARPVLHAPGTAAVSFDEAWLLAGLAAFERGDEASARFLLARRCHPQRVPALALLMQAYAARLA